MDVSQLSSAATQNDKQSLLVVAFYNGPFDVAHAQPRAPVRWLLPGLYDVKLIVVPVALEVIQINPFAADSVKALHFAILVWPTIFNFWHTGTLVLRTERQSAQMSKI